ncbi:NAD-binding of NADP-dependent 3-hydroxyisobutyrate dehydrogenase-domain-containing protein [Naematelia encephala]|uniref:3-hydroxyisobutyrate dehydrogenase n=1 Tax=Naematelia encephala TaxID=71784 RepID=A0A1Y2AGW2_9TREE|nr:NAD-binding of NADP-dependent 3-hydroxyisobutyrate dehydrogenase-domain-containing protein [Naematelia encephala]
MIPSIARLSRSSTIGWIGLGAMGHPMALNLFTKTCQALQPDRPLPRFVICEPSDKHAHAFLAELGGLASQVDRVGSGREVAQAAARVITMLPSTPQVESVYLDSGTGILRGLKDVPSDTQPLQVGLGSKDSTIQPVPRNHAPHTLLIDQTTLDPTFAISLAERVHSTVPRTVLLDAPVSGGIIAARAGTLSIMLGSPSPLATSLAIPLLQNMAREGGIVECGKNGAGIGAKVCNNLILAINQIALAEGLSLGKSLGIQENILHEVINSSSGQSWSSRSNTPLASVPLSPGSRAFQGGFQSRLMLKDVGLALHAAHQHDLPTPLGWAAESVYSAVCTENDGEMAGKDFSVVYEWLRRKQAEGVERGWKDDLNSPTS